MKNNNAYFTAEISSLKAKRPNEGNPNNSTRMCLLIRTKGTRNAFREQTTHFQSLQVFYSGLKFLFSRGIHPNC